MSTANSWLQRQRKSDLVEIAQNVGLKEYVRGPRELMMSFCVGQAVTMMDCFLLRPMCMPSRAP
jgi:hypothetical protein